MVASKLPQILQLNPTDELVFLGPFDKVVTSYLELTNPSDRRVCFKVKTTAPRRYCVRPNSGIIEPSGKTKIAIMLQPMEPNSYNERDKHKFMVQSMIVPPEVETGVFDQIWTNASPKEIMDSKLKCTFKGSVEAEHDSSNIDVSARAKTNAPITGESTKSKTNEPATDGSGQAKTNAPNIGESAKAKTNESAAETSLPDLVASIKSTSTPTATKHIFSPASSDKQATSQHLSQAELSKGQSLLAESRKIQQQQLLSSFHDSFHQSMSDDKKIVLVSLLMLLLGVLLGKYII